MGQVSTPQSPPSLILSAVDRLVAANAGGGISPLASHIILLGEDAGQNLGASNVIALGHDTLSSGFAAGSGIEFSVVIGEGSFPGPADLLTGRDRGSGAVTVVGGNTYAAMTTSRRMAGLIAIGPNIAQHFTGVNDGGMDRSILIGDSIFKFNTLDNALSSGNIIIGHQAASRVSLDGQATQYIENTIVGEDGGPQGNTLATIVGDTIIGARSGQGLLSGQGNNTIVGRRTAPSLVTGGLNVVVGAGADVAGGALDSIVIGGNNVQADTSDSVYLGAAQSGAMTGDRNVFIGRGAGDGEPSANSDRFLVEVFTAGAVRSGLLYGRLDLGNLIVGLSTPGLNRDTDGTNTLKLLDGTPGAGAPAGGGRFNVTAGELSWFSSAGVNYALTPAASRGNFLVAALPAVGLAAGQRAFVTNALAPAFGAAPAGGGAVFVPVFYNGAAWIVG